MRSALGHRAQISARSAGDRVVVCPARHARPPGAAVPGFTRGQWVTHERCEMRWDARRFENWEAYYAGKIGLEVAIEYALQWGIEAIGARVTHLADDLRRQLSGIAGVTVRDEGVDRCSLVSFTVAGSEADEVHRRLARATHQRVGVPCVLDPARHGGPRSARPGAGVGALLQHRGGD